MFYAKRTVEEQKERLPLLFRSNYEATQLDRLEIDGNVFQGYFEYSYLAEKSYMVQPVRSNDGSIGDIEQYSTFLTPRLVIKYSMMDIEDYRHLMTLLQSKNEFTVTLYDIVLDKRVTHKMYFATPEMPIIYQQYLKVMGIREQTIELIGTNNGVENRFVYLDYNIPEDISWDYTKLAIQKFPANVAEPLGADVASYDAEIDGETVSVQLNSEKTREIMSNKYTFKCWNTSPDGSGFNYMDGTSYFFHEDIILYAIWQVSEQ